MTGELKGYKTWKTEEWSKMNISLPLLSSYSTRNWTINFEIYCDTWSLVAESCIPQMAKSSAWFPVFGRDTSTPRFVKALNALNSFPESWSQISGFIINQVTGEFFVFVLVEKCKSSLHGSMSHSSIMPGKFGLVESHGTVTIKVFHVFHHNLGEIERYRSCVGGPVKPSYLRWVPEAWFWTTSSWFKESNLSIVVDITPFEEGNVVVTDDSGIQILVTVNFWHSLNITFQYHLDHVMTGKLPG